MRRAPLSRGSPPCLASVGIGYEEATVQVRDVMTSEVVTVGPATSAKYAAEVMAERGLAALPVVDGDNQLIGIVAEAASCETACRTIRGCTYGPTRMRATSCSASSCGE